jgi:hypothetical protein
MRSFATGHFKGLCAAVVAIGTVTSRGGAQVATVDEGSFTVTRGAATLGREEFKIVRQSGGGAAFVARATGAYGDRRVLPVLQTDAEGVPERYQVEVRRGAAVEQRVSGQAAGAHFRAQTQGESGEAAREFLLEPGTVLLDTDLFHQYYFIVRRAGTAGATTRVVALAPRRGDQAPLSVTDAGAEAVTIGGQPVAARHYVLTGAAGRRDVWADEQGRVLRVVLSAEGTEALRTAPPR